MKNVLVLGGDADANLGDAAILTAICHRFAATDPNVRITVVSGRRRPADLPGLVRAIVPGPAGFGELIAIAPRQHLIVFGGGGVLQDDDSRIKVPYWAARLSALKLLQQNIAGLSIGAGPLHHAESRFFAAAVCRVLRSISVRDEFAHSWLQPCTPKPVTVVPDPAFMLHPAEPQAAATFIRSLGLSPDRPLLGVVMRGWFHRRGGFIPRKVRARFGGAQTHGSEERAQLTATFVAELRLLASRLDASIILMPSYPLRHEGDLQACHALATGLDGVPTAIASIDDPALYKAVAGRLVMMVSARMHPLILAAAMGVPIVGLGYNGKFDGLFRLLELPHQLLDLNQLPQAPAGWLERPARTALEECGDLRHRCALLAHRVADHTSRLLYA